MVKRTPRRAELDEAWKAIVFGDLHVKAPTIDRCVEVLKRVRALALEHDAFVVCTGDFWDLRGVLSVRQLDRIQDELDAHKGIEWVMIPGNHDQVTRDGRVHGLRVFDAYPNIRVVTQPDGFEDRKVYFIPWREDAEEQRRLFGSAPAGRTIFGHGEYRGAVANTKHRAEGRFGAADIAHARAVYLGHYHKRQQLDDKVWYVGSPYEQNMGERGMPHGVAIVSSSDPAHPTFVDFTDLPRHWRLTWPDDAKKLRKPAEHDFVELRVAKSDLSSPEFSHARTQLVAKDVRPILLETVSKEDVPVSFALSLSEAVDQYAQAGAVPGVTSDDLQAVGHGLLGEVEDKHAIVPKGSVIHLHKLSVEGFGPIRARVSLPLAASGTVLIRGPMGAGKTALAADAITWCLYGMTAPRKPGTAGASLRADDVINDSCSEARVTLALRLDDRKATYRITRTKVRGKGAKIEVTRNKEPWGDVGISDAQDLIHHLIGMDYDLWRTCVSLGQGEVSTFVTDAQKRRTELLERAFRLQACPPAQVLARKRRKEAADKADEIRTSVVALRAKIEVIGATDYTAKIAAWEDGKARAVEEQRNVISRATEDIAGFDAALVHEAGWADRAEKLRAAIDDAHAKAQATDKRSQMGKLHAEIGGVEAEIGIATRDLTQLQKSLQTSQRSGVCTACGQALPLEVQEQHLVDVEARIQSRRAEIASLEVKASNLKASLGQLASAHTVTDVTGLSVSLREAEKALTAIGQIKAKRARTVEVSQEALSIIQRWDAAVNPWQVEYDQQQAALSKLQATCASREVEMDALDSQAKVYAYWEEGFGPNGLPVLVLRTAIHELEMHANAFLGKALNGRVNTELEMLGDELEIRFREYEDGEMKVRDYLQLSGGQRRCVQLAFTPFALSEMVFARMGVRIPFLVIDELTTHLDADTKPLVCQALRDLDRETILVIDHDLAVQGEFDEVYDVSRGGQIRRSDNE